MESALDAGGSCTAFEGLTAREGDVHLASHGSQVRSHRLNRRRMGMINVLGPIVQGQRQMMRAWEREAAKRIPKHAGSVMSVSLRVTRTSA